MKRRARNYIRAVFWLLAALTVPAPVYADNCSGLGDCYGQIAVAVAAAVLIGVAVFALFEIAAAAAAADAILAEGAAAVAEAEAAAAATAAAEAAAAEAAAAVESGIISEAQTILSSTEMAQLRAAFAAGEYAEVSIAGRTIVLQPNLPFSGFTLSGESGFVLGSEAFASETELAKTVLHELYRLSTSTVLGGEATGAAVAAETNAAFEFAERVVSVVLRGLR